MPLYETTHAHCDPPPRVLADVHHDGGDVVRVHPAVLHALPGRRAHAPRRPAATRSARRGAPPYPRERVPPVAAAMKRAPTERHDDSANLGVATHARALPRSPMLRDTPWLSPELE